MKITKGAVFLLQNMFPTIEKYVDHVHIINGEEAKVISSIEKIEHVFNKVMNLIKIGKKVVFTDIDNDMKIMIEKLKKEN